MIGTPNGAGIGYTDAGNRIIANARAIAGFAADGLVDGVTISSTGFIDPSAVAFESASSMLLLDSEDGLGGSVYRVDLGHGRDDAAGDERRHRPDEDEHRHGHHDDALLPVLVLRPPRRSSHRRRARRRPRH